MEVLVDTVVGVVMFAVSRAVGEITGARLAGKIAGARSVGEIAGARSAGAVAVVASPRQSRGAGGS